MSNVTLAEEHRRCDRLSTCFHHSLAPTGAWRRFLLFSLITSLILLLISWSRSPPVLTNPRFRPHQGLEKGCHPRRITRWDANCPSFFYVTLHFITTKFDLIYSLEACTSSLGLENGQIRDKQISASSELEKQQAAKQGRVSLSSFPQDRCDIR